MFERQDREDYGKLKKNKETKEELLKLSRNKTSASRIFVMIMKRSLNHQFINRKTTTQETTKITATEIENSGNAIP